MEDRSPQRAEKSQMRVPCRSLNAPSLQSLPASVAIVGMAKNAGKTTTLNAVVQTAVAKRTVLGVTSAGRDGEAVDEVTGLNKPSIWLPAGTLFVTATQTRERCCTHRVLQNLEIGTAMGNLLLCKAMVDGDVEVAGAGTQSAGIACIRSLHEHGAHLALIDGAAGRIFSCAPSIAQSTILATGAALSNNLETVVERTAHFIDLLELASPPAEIRPIAEEVLAQGGSAFLGESGALSLLTLPTMLNRGHDIAKQMREKQATTLITCGAVTDSLVDALLQKVNAVRIIIPDLTHIFIGRIMTRRLRRAGGSLQTLHRARLLAVTINPWSPWGQGFPPDRFAAEIEQISPVPVYNLKNGQALHEALIGDREWAD